MSTTAVATRTAAARAGRPSRTLATVVSLVAVPAALAVSGLVVAQSSYSAYSATTSRPQNNWSSGTVALTDDDSNAAAFSVANARPGATGSRCLVVTSNGSLPSEVRIYGANGTGTTSLAAYVDLTITQGTGGSFGSCDGFAALPDGAEVFRGSLMTFGMAHTGYANGVGGWSPAGTTPESRTYKLSYAISPDAPNETMGGTAGGDIVFEAQS
ncbi:hypothetical protein [Microlunatus flavus]|uniref:Camelysin metallo-endopeptidase n=1 Tax=Microlunatus flavus TaxID=1036181 RepID=A0A1H9J119_9ACTN|nr:hypothetical protein [Microlunatus flavus]SEQ80315.1 hypothetical protein SAMN05421756_10650 [Microlunatus flavus]